MAGSSLYQGFKKFWRRVRQVRKDAQLAVARILLDRQQTGMDFDPESVKRVAVLRWDDKLGDSVMATLFIDAVHRARPDINITYITGPQGAMLLTDWAYIARLEVCGRRGWRTAWELRKLARDYDVVIELTSSMSAYELFALTSLRGRHYMGYGKSGYRLFDLHIPDNALHFADRYLAAAELLVGSKVDGNFYLPQSESADNAVRSYTESLPLGQASVLINLFAAGKHRSFTEADAEDFLRWWIDCWPDMNLMLLSVPGREELLDRLIAQIGNLRITRSPSPPSIELTVAMARAADLVFSPDTAVVHIVAALKCPLVAVYRLKGVEFDSWRPTNENVRIIFNRQAEGRYDRVPAADFPRHELKTAVDDILAELNH